MSAAEVLRPLVGATLGDDAAVRVRCWDGSGYGPPDAPVQVVFRRRRALRRLLWAPNELGFARAYVSGDVDLEGDVFTGLAELDRLADPRAGPGDRRGRPAPGRRCWPRRCGWASSGRRHGRRRRSPGSPAGGTPGGATAAAVTHHYDVGNDFYELVLGPSLTYSCAYFAGALGGVRRSEDGPARPSATSSPASSGCDRACGCWTSAAAGGPSPSTPPGTYGVRAVGVTLSPAQAELARERVARRRAWGTGSRSGCRTTGTSTDGPFDAIASIGMAEHVGHACCPDYARTCTRCWRRADGCSTTPSPAVPDRRDEPSRTSFIERYVFPDGELEPLGGHGGRAGGGRPRGA